MILRLLAAVADRVMSPQPCRWEFSSASYSRPAPRPVRVVTPVPSAVPPAAGGTGHQT